MMKYCFSPHNHSHLHDHIHSLHIHCISRLDLYIYHDHTKFHKWIHCRHFHLCNPCPPHTLDHTRGWPWCYRIVRLSQCSNNHNDRHNLIRWSFFSLRESTILCHKSGHSCKNNHRDSFLRSEIRYRSKTSIMDREVKQFEILWHTEIFDVNHA